MINSYRAFYCPDCGRTLTIMEYGFEICDCGEDELPYDIEEEIEEICRSLDQ